MQSLEVVRFSEGPLLEVLLYIIGIYAINIFTFCTNLSQEVQRSVYSFVSHVTSLCTVCNNVNGRFHYKVHMILIARTGGHAMRALRIENS